MYRYRSRKFLAFVVIAGASFVNGVSGASIDTNILWKAALLYVGFEGTADLISRGKDAVTEVQKQFPVKHK